ncbi:MAG TPA: hypothetical protein P5560_10505 [Thermotogota bacterium]|nr:hypothetical protein [Thermotogota bacterium]HRW93367.1 hypothetical protein [Thermotogota bacterium]
MKNLVFLVLTMLVFFPTVLASTSDPEVILEKFSQEQILEEFQRLRMFEWVDRYDEKRDGIYILSTRWLYKVRLMDDGTLHFQSVKTRQEHDQMFPFWVIMTLFIVSGLTLTLIFLWPTLTRLFSKK